MGPRRQRTGRAAGAPVTLLVVRDSRHPWVISLLLGCILAGALGVWTAPDPRNLVDQYMHGIWRDVYYWVLLASGLITLVGVCLPDLRDRLMVEQIGLWFLSAPLLIYPIAIFASYSGTFGLGASVSCLVGVGSLIRIGSIFRELRVWRQGDGSA